MHYFAYLNIGFVFSNNLLATKPQGHETAEIRMSLRAPDLILRMHRKENSPLMSLRRSAATAAISEQCRQIGFELALNWVCFHHVSNPIYFTYPLVIIDFEFISGSGKLALFFQINPAREAPDLLFSIDY